MLSFWILFLDFVFVRVRALANMSDFLALKRLASDGWWDVEGFSPMDWGPASTFFSAAFCLGLYTCGFGVKGC